jgi:hypothetical protein
MSKVDELKAKYPKMTTATFNKFVDADKTKTKKYLEYFCKVWSSKYEYNFPGTSSELIYIVNEFDSHIPYVENKDIYSDYYTNVKNLYTTVERATELKDEKTFIKEGNVEILEENDSYILLRPLTHKASVKYGANTKWCTSGKNAGSLFNNYIRKGYLVYLISKNVMQNKDYQKVAFYMEGTSALFGNIDSYDVMDRNFNDETMIKNGWKSEEVYKITTKIRGEYYNWKTLKQAKDKIYKAMTNLTSIDFDELKQHIEVVEKSKDFDYISSVKETINEFVKETINEFVKKLELQL